MQSTVKKMFIGDTAPPASLAQTLGQSGTQRASQMLVEQVRLLHDNALLSQLIALFNAGILSYVQWGVVDRPTIVFWLTCMVSVSLLRLGQARAFARAADMPERVSTWRNRFLLGVGASGILWGAAGVFLFPDHSLPHQVFVSFVIAGMIAGAVATLSPMISAFALFTVPATLPIVLQFLLRGGEVFFPMAVMAVLYGLAMAAVARHVNASIRTSLSLSHRNGELVEVLTGANAHAEQLNCSLQAEVAERRAKETALRESEESLEAAQRMAHLGSWTYDPLSQRASWSPETFHIYGVEAGGAVPSCWQLLSHLHSDDRRRVYGLLKRALTVGEPYETEFRIVTPQRVMRWVHALGQPMVDATGKTVFMRGTVLDITQRKSQERQLDSERKILQAIATGSRLSEVLDQLCRNVEEQSPSLMCSVLLLDRGGKHLHLGAAPSLPMEYNRAVDGMKIGANAGSCGTAAFFNRQIIVPDIASDPLWENWRASALTHGLQACWSTPIPGTDRPVLGTFAVYTRTPCAPTSEDSALIARATDIARIAIERSEAEERIRQLAHYDELTGLPNRLLFHQAFEHALRRAERNARSLALLFVDVDRFKNINDTLGHDAGDSLLKEVGARLRASLRASDVLARFGGDEFVVLLEELPPEGYVAAVAANLLEALAVPLRIREQEFGVTASIGIATFPQDGRDAQTLQKNADIAMYRAKDQGRNSYCFYAPQGNVHSLERLTMEAQLRRALERGELELHYQPKQDISSGGVTGMEALLRWRHPELGMVPPARFIPLAEETGLIVPIGEWVLRTACAQTAALRSREGLPMLRVAVNLSARQFAEDSLIRLVSDVLDETGLGADALELEITESLVMQNPEQTAKLLVLLKQMGVHLAMDDFGTGYSSLAYLKRFPIDSIKIDRSFIQGLPGDVDDATITQAVIAMAHSLRLRAIAEGVETKQQLQFLREHRCDEIQGYYFSRPLPFDQFIEHMRAHAASRPASYRGTAPIGIPVWP